MVPLSYIFPKDSRNILFAKFGSTELKLWIFEAYDFMSQNVRKKDIDLTIGRLWLVDTLCKWLAVDINLSHDRTINRENINFM